MPAIQTAPRWKRRPDARPDEIMTAALAVFGDVGFARAKLDDIAGRAGVSKGTLYLYFDSKEALFREMVTARVATNVAAAQALVRSHSGPTADLLEQLLRQGWASLVRTDMVSISRLVHSEIMSDFPDLARFYFDSVILPFRRILKRVLARGIAAGEFRQDVPRFAQRAVMSLLVHGAMYQRIFRRHDPHPFTDAEVIDGIVDLLEAGVATRSRRSRGKP
jgi:AcrR family transcriptional regulator